MISERSDIIKQLYKDVQKDQISNEYYGGTNRNSA